MVYTDQYTGVFTGHDPYDNFIKKNKAAAAAKAAGVAPPPTRREQKKAIKAAKKAAPAMPSAVKRPGLFPKKQNSNPVTGGGGVAKKTGLFGIKRNIPAAVVAKITKPIKKAVPGFGFLNKNNQKAEVAPITPEPNPEPGLRMPQRAPGYVENNSPKDPEVENLAEGASSDLEQINNTTTPSTEAATEESTAAPAEAPAEEPATEKEAPESEPTGGEEESYDHYEDEYGRWDGRGRKFVSHYYGYDETAPKDGTSAAAPSSKTTEPAADKKKENKVSASAWLGFAAVLAIAALTAYIVVNATDNDVKPPLKPIH